jgi:hypothetical protein
MRLASDSSESLISIYSTSHRRARATSVAPRCPTRAICKVDDKLQGDRMYDSKASNWTVFNPTEFGEDFAQGCLLALIDGIGFLEDRSIPMRLRRPSCCARGVRPRASAPPSPTMNSRHLV